MDELHRQAQLRLQQGMPPARIAEQLGLDEATVEMLLREAPAEMRTRLPGLLRSFRRQRAPSETIPPQFTTRDGIEVVFREVPAEDVVSTWRDLSNDAAATGRWPVIVSDRGLPGYDPVQRMMQTAIESRAEPAPSIIENARTLDPRSLLAKGWQDGYPLEEEDAEVFEAFSEEIPDEPVSPIPADLLPSEGVTTIALVPCADSTEIPAVLGFGGWNACPPPEQHVAILDYWRNRYEARLQAIAPDTLELEVGDPPTTYSVALELAKEQFSYTSDVLYQGAHPTIGALAVALQGSTRWHFWWD